VERSGPIVIALAGNPNSGKTSLFNFITGSHQHVGNYPGVTVEKKEGAVRVDDAEVSFTDLPGTYSLFPLSEDERVARDELVFGRPDTVIIVADSTKLERNLYLASQIIEIGIPCVLALNMFDEFESTGGSLDIDQLSRILGIPCVRTVGNRGKGVTDLMSVALKAARGEIPAIGKPPVYRHEMEHAIERVWEMVRGKTPYHERWTAIALLLHGPALFSRGDFSVSDTEKAEIDAVRGKLEEIEKATVRAIVTEGRFGYASGAVAECLKTGIREPLTPSERIDSIVANRLFGFPIFLAILWVMFQATFRLGDFPMHWIFWLFVQLGHLMSHAIPAGIARSLVVDGLIAGVGGVLVFLPNIIILFLFISLLEDTGYMARAAFIMDRVMHCFGLHGKTFIPMIVGFGCTVPAIMATRILEHRRDRLIAIFILPFISCGARLPVYILLAGAFFSPETAGNVIFTLYLIGVALSLLVARVLTLFGGPSTPFVMELPPYRIPTARSVLIHLWERAFMYLRKAGTIILACSLLLWFLMSFPRTVGPVSPENPEGIRTDIGTTFAGQAGKLIEPALRPLGFDWRIGVALTAGFAAKEVIVSTLGTIYSLAPLHGGTGTVSLRDSLRNDPSLDPVKGYGLMLFILIYIPCAATIGVVRREAGGWRWAALLAVYTTSLAWLVCFAFIRLAGMFV
jgi:ferrous iron transport protein B